MTTAATLLQRLSTRVQHGCTWLHKTLDKPHADSPVDLADPMGGALKDAELLVAFAAQSRRSIEPKKVLALTTAVAQAAQLRAAGGQPTAAERAAFWTAYDEFAVDIAPLSAHSIRASVRVNSRRFPLSLATPTAVNALLAIAVFYVCLSLQGFWVAGKEMIERAETLDKQKAELNLKLSRNDGETARIQNRIDQKRDHLCRLGDCAWPRAGMNPASKPAADGATLAALRAEQALALGEYDEKFQVDRELSRDMRALSDRSRPLEVLMTQWHERARGVCDASLLGSRPLTFVCPVEAIKAQDNRATLRSNIDALRDQLKQSRTARLNTTATSSQAQLGQERPPPEAALYARAMSRQSPADWQAEQDLRALEQQLGSLDADHFGRVVVEARLIVANLGTYLIAMVMGLLGALTYILRTLSQQLRDHTYVPVSASLSVVRICLGAIAGVFGSLLVPVSETGLKSLPPLFIPFVFGYGIEILFSLLDKVVRSFTQAEPAPPPRRAQ